MGLGRDPVRAVRRARLPRARRRSFRPPPRHPVRDLGAGRPLRRSGAALDGGDQHRRARLRPVPDLCGGCPLDGEHAGHPGHPRLRRRVLPHRPLASRAGLLRGEARRRDRHGLLRDPGDPRDRSRGGARDGAPAHAAVRLPCGQSARHARRDGGGESELGLGPRDDAREPRRLPLRRPTRARPSTAHPRAARSALREAVAARQLRVLPRELQRHRDQRGSQPDDGRFRARQDPRDRARPRDRREVDARPLRDDEAADPRERLLRDLQPRQRHVGRPARGSDRAVHARQAWSRGRASTRSTCSCWRPASMRSVARCSV